ncbi:MAG TPA: hypothetical protein ENH01_06495 [Nitrospirae bacterium]|nr:hypothetical protein [Nitrospirota bacterium]
MAGKLKIFCVAGIVVGLTTGLFCSFRYGMQAGVICGLVSGLVSGLVMFLIIGLLHIHAVKKIAPELSEESYGIHHVRDIKLQYPYDRAFNLCIESLGRIKNCKIRMQDRTAGQIIAKTSINWKTWGDTISLEIKRIDDTQTHVKTSSRPSMSTTIVDYGKNLENVEKILSFLKNTVTY